MAWGALGVLAFSLTLPATRLADPAFGGFTVGFGRAAVAGLLAAAVLAARGEALLPPRRQWRAFALVAGGVVIGFPVCTSLALQSVQSVHAAVVTGLVPAATAGMAVWRAGERPTRRYWTALAGGLVAVLLLAVTEGAGSLGGGDLLLGLAVALAGVGYAEGGVLAREHAGWRVICWALVLTLPASLAATAVCWAARPPHAVTAPAAAGFAYVSLVSMLLGFVAWYRGLARGGIARVGRLQVAQPALTMTWSALLLGERVSLASALVGAAVLVSAVAQGGYPTRSALQRRDLAADLSSR
jgi:drug/metabolite transporter (DMT)-like permease